MSGVKIHRRGRGVRRVSFGIPAFAGMTDVVTRSAQRVLKMRVKIHRRGRGDRRVEYWLSAFGDIWISCHSGESRKRGPS